MMKLFKRRKLSRVERWGQFVVRFGRVRHKMIGHRYIRIYKRGKKYMVYENKTLLFSNVGNSENYRDWMEQFKKKNLRLR